jgi:UDP-N-acetylmuramate: L-alanyl-gamma-D-glutamyl-meso-diaminopimelate ligase
VAGSGRIVSNGGDAALERVLARGCWTPVERFDVAGGWAALDVAEGTAHEFDVAYDGERFGRLRLPLAGAHNRSNALAAIAAARHAGVAPALAIEALARFQGVKRRLEVRGVHNGITVYDDFAHHPTAIAVTIDGLRRKVGAARILAVLEPRSNTMKLGAMKAQLPHSLRAADQVFGYGAREGKNALGWNLSDSLAPLGERAQAFDDLDRLVASVAAAARSGDHVLVMSNGGFGGVHGRLLDALAART